MPHFFRTLLWTSSVVFGWCPTGFVGFNSPFPIFVVPLVCHPSYRHTNTQPFYSLIILSSHLQPPQEYCWECVRTTINTRDPSRSGCVSAPGMSMGVNSFAALLSATRHSMTGFWMLQRRQGILSFKVCWYLFICIYWW